MACNVITALQEENGIFLFLWVQKHESWLHLATGATDIVVAFLLLLHGKMKWKYSLRLFAISHCCGKFLFVNLNFHFIYSLSHFMCHKRFIKDMMGMVVQHSAYTRTNAHKNWGEKLETVRKETECGKSQRVNLIKACTKRKYQPSNQQANQMDSNKANGYRSHRFSIDGGYNIRTKQKIKSKPRKQKKRWVTDAKNLFLNLKIDHFCLFFPFKKNNEKRNLLCCR